MHGLPMFRLCSGTALIIQLIICVTVSTISVMCSQDAELDGSGGLTATGEPMQIVNFISASPENSDTLYMGTESVLSFNYSIHCVSMDDKMIVNVESADLQVVEVTGNTTFDVNCKTAKLRRLSANTTVGTPGSAHMALSSGTRDTYVSEATIDIQVRSNILGISSLVFTVLPAKNGTMAYTHAGDTASDAVDATLVYGSYEYPVKVLRVIRPVDVIFRVVVYCVQVFVGTGFGTKLDLKVVKENLRRPIGPGIGFICQYLMMPLIAFAVTQALNMGSSVVAFGIFIAGCCPGGGASNMYSYLLNGDLSLSITMTAISTISALAMLPIWIYSLGSVYLAGNDVTIPFTTVLISLCILILPLLFGVGLRLKFPKAADVIEKILKPITLVLILVLLVVGIYSNMFLFRMFKPRILLAGSLLPYIGYLIGGSVSAIFRQEWKCVKTIAIETGLQNTNIAYILLTSSFPAPYGDIAAVAPVASAVMTPLPLFVVTICYLLYQRCRKRYQPVAKEDDQVTMNDLPVKA